MHEGPPQLNESSEPTIDFEVGDVVIHPLRGGEVPIEFLGTEVYRFRPPGTMHKAEWIEAIDGSRQYEQLRRQGWEEEFAYSRPCAEVDLSDDINRRTIVVPLDALQRP